VIHGPAFSFVAAAGMMGMHGMMKPLFVFAGVCCFAARDEGCDATLEESSLKGAGPCTKAGVEQLSDPQTRALMKCFHECAAGYHLETGKGNDALAVPERKTCNSQYWKVTCDSVLLKCSKPFAEFPNSCSGVVRANGSPLYIAFYSYCAPDWWGWGYKHVLHTSIVLGKGNVCAATYNFNTEKGSCLGLVEGKTCDKAVHPIQPPLPSGLPYPYFPPPGEEDSWRSWLFDPDHPYRFALLAGLLIPAIFVCACLCICRCRTKYRQNLRELEEVEIPIRVNRS